jgi:hypothetical protein
MPSFPLVLTIDEAAQRLRASPEQIKVELEAGRLDGFKVGDEWRTTEAALLTFMGISTSTPNERTTAMTATAATPPPAPADFRTHVDAAEWRPIEPFDYQWPKEKGKVQPPEHYEEAYEARVKLAGREQAIRIGFCNRESAGDKDRRRAVVFLGTYPLVEFSGENSDAFAQTGRLASVIKLPSGQHLRPGDSIPPEYDGFRLVTYNELVVGPYAAAILAVVAHKDELSVMAHHGLIRARGKGLI